MAIAQSLITVTLPSKTLEWFQGLKEAVSSQIEPNTKELTD